MGSLGPFELDTIVPGGCLDVMRQMPDGCVDLVVTDPPYLKRLLYLYEHLANECPRIMKRGASLTTIVGHYALEKVMSLFKDKLKYRWIINMDQSDGPHPRMAMGIEVTWKPVLWYVKGAYPQGRGFIRDSFPVTGTDGQRKERHHWEQDASWAEYLIQKLSAPGDLVLDPFMGSGTTAVAAKKLGRHYFGCDINPDYVRMANERVAQVDGTQLELIP